MILYPLKFKPRFVEKMWGGRKIQTVLGKSPPEGKLIGESWELYDFPPGTVDNSKTWLSSEVINGPLAGKTLHELVQQLGHDLYGDVPLAGAHGQFPILIKFLDANQDLSVQVHPDAAYAAAHPEAYLKSEAWFIVQADDGSRLLKGLQPGVTRESFTKAIADGSVESSITSITVREGQCYYLPSGTVHALGAGILAAEVQTPSDTTFRVFDFNRIDPATGKLRTLHVEKAMECIDFSPKPEAPPAHTRIAGPLGEVSHLVTSEYFQIDKVRINEGIRQLTTTNRPVIWMVLEGKAELTVDGVSEPVTASRGDTILFPAKLKNLSVNSSTECVWLEVTFPIPPKGSKP